MHALRFDTTQINIKKKNNLKKYFDRFFLILLRLKF